MNADEQPKNMIMTIENIKILVKIAKGKYGFGSSIFAGITPSVSQVRGMAHNDMLDFCDAIEWLLAENKRLQDIVRDCESQMMTVNRRIATLESQTQYVPDWEDAPEWANWWAFDADGTAYWYEVMPEPYKMCWRIPGDTPTRFQFDGLSVFHWSKSLRQRPEQVPA